MEAKPMNRLKISHCVRNNPDLEQIEYTIELDINDVHYVKTGVGKSIEEAKQGAIIAMSERMRRYINQELHDALKD